MKFTIEQHAGQWEPIPEGNFETQDAALAAMRDLEESMGWRDLRVVRDAGPRHDLSGRPLTGDNAHEVVEYGLAS